MAVEITDSNFDKLITNSNKPGVIDLWAEWCGPCRMMGPIIEELANEYGDKVVIGKLNVDNNPTITAKYGIRNIPTLLFFKNGKMVDKMVGVTPKATIKQKIDSLL